MSFADIPVHMNLFKATLLLCSLNLAGCESIVMGEFTDEPSSDNADQGSEIRVGNFPGPDGLIRAPYILQGNTAIVGGDILWSANSALSIHSAAGPFSRWTGGIIPYLNNENNQYFEAGVRAWNAVTEQTGIKLVPYTDQNNYIQVTSDNGCTSYMGMIGGMQPVSMAPGCVASSAIHEIGHAIGMMHEHTRADRDSYIRINWDNVTGGENGSFAAVALAITQGATNYTSYDFQSIMHYRNTGFGPDYVIDDSIPLYEVLGNGSQAVNNTVLSAGDIAGVAAMYEGFGFDSEGGQTPPDNSCPQGLCSDYNLSEGACEDLSTGSFSCVSGCMEKVTNCGQDSGGSDDNGDLAAFTCTTGQIIPAEWECDSVSDCPDGEDESSCGQNQGGAGNSAYGSCTVAGTPGDCIDTSVTTCFGDLISGYCPGSNSIQCCL